MSGARVTKSVSALSHFAQIWNEVACGIPMMMQGYNLEDNITLSTA
jgi:hypothetical protein